MKKILLIFILCTLGLSLTACSSESNPSSTIDTSELVELAKTQVSDMTNGNFKSTLDAFSPDVANQIDEATLQSTWDTTVAQLGDYIGTHAVNSEVVESYTTVTIVEAYTFSGLKITITYDADKQIVGLNLNLEALSQPLVSNDLLEEVPVTLGETLPLDGVLTLPKAVANPPVVLLVHGSGSTDKDSTIYANTPFKDIAHGLAEQGIASLRYDKRFFAYPEKASELGANLTLKDEVLDDIDTAISFLLEEARVDASNIYVLGHSLGGGLTPYIASTNESVKGIISMAGTLRPLYELSYDQNKASEEAVLNGSFDEATVEMVMTQMEQVEKDILTLRGDLTAIPNEQILIGLPAGYQKSAKDYAGEHYINAIDIPILVLQGTEDFQVSATVDYTLWETTLADRENVVLKLYDGLNHLMMPTNGKQDITEYQTKSTVSSDVINDIAHFINQ